MCAWPSVPIGAAGAGLGGHHAREQQQRQRRRHRERARGGQLVAQGRQQVTGRDRNATNDIASGVDEIGLTRGTQRTPMSAKCSATPTASSAAPGAWRRAQPHEVPR